MLIIPALSPSRIASLSIVRVADTRGNFVLRTTKTFKPFGKVKKAGSPTLITGAGPGLGACVLSTWAHISTGNKMDMDRINFFILNYLKFFR